MINVVVKKEGVKSRTNLNSNKDLYQKLIVIAVIVVLVIGVFLFVNLRGVGKATGQPNYDYDSDPGTIEEKYEYKGIVYYETPAKMSSAYEQCPGPSCFKNCGENSCYILDQKCNWIVWKQQYDCAYNKAYVCFAPNTVIRKNVEKNFEITDSEAIPEIKITNPEGSTYDFLCKPKESTTQEAYVGLNWLGCNDNSGVMKGYEKFYCGDSNHIYPCIAETDGKFDGTKSFSGKSVCVAAKQKWFTCSDKLAEKDRVQSDKLYCNQNLQKKWTWQECTEKGTDIYSNDKTKKCDGTKWIDWAACNEDLQNKLIDGDKFYCNKDSKKKWTWQECKKDVSESWDHDLVCKDNKWSAVTEKEVCYGGDCKTCDSTLAGQMHPKTNTWYCDGKVWGLCNNLKKFGLSTDKKVYCGGDLNWDLCGAASGKNKIGPIPSTAPNQYQFLCDDSKQQWITCESSLSLKLMFTDKFYCGLKDEKWQWQKCSSEGSIVSDNSRICKNNKWIPCTSTSKSVDFTWKQFYCDGSLWQTCNKGSQGKNILESNTLLWICKDNVWNEHKCDTEGKIVSSYKCDKVQNVFSWKTFSFTDENVELSLDKNYEVKFGKFTSIKSINSKYLSVTVCDTDSDLNPNEATVCYSTGKGAKTQEKVLSQGKPVQISKSDPFMFLYYGLVDNKKVAGAVHKVEVKDAILDLSEENIYYGQNLILHFANDNYLISYPQTQGQSGNSLTGAFTLMPLDLKFIIPDIATINTKLNSYSAPLPSDVFLIDKLQLTLLKDATGKSYTGNKLAGASNCLVFEGLEQGKSLSFCLEGGALKLHPKALSPGYQAEPTNVNLEEQYESYISASQSLNILGIISKDTGFSKVYLCDKVSSNEKADICFGTESNKKGIDSLNYLNGASSNIYIKSGVAFLYETVISDPGSKQVKAILVKDITSDVTLEKNAFMGNMKTGKRLVLKLGTSYYLLSHPNVGTGDYSSNQLILQYLPSLVNYPNSGYVTLVGKGVQGVQFVPYEGTTITVYPDGNNYKISSKLSKAIATTSSLPQDINNAYEVSFNQKNPVKLLNINGQEPVISVCNNDDDIDPYKMLVCISNKPEITLTKNTPKNETIAGKEFVLIYLLNVSKTYSFGFVNLLYTLSSDVQTIDYNNFMNNLAKSGRHLAFKFADKLYLIQHSYPAENFELTNLSLAYYQDMIKIDIPSVGSEKKVTFSLPDGGRITLERDPYEETPPPFKIYAQTQLQIADIPINMEDTLYTTFTSEAPAKLVKPDLGLIRANTETGGDIKSSEDYFKIIAGDKIVLAKNKPLVKSLTGENFSLLFYYDNAYIIGDKYVKSTKIYLMYDITAKEKAHYFNDQFITTFTSGNELALKFGNSYYLLGYEGSSLSQAAYFTKNKIRLRALNGSASYLPSATDDGQAFSVSEGNILVKVDEINNQIIFSTTSKEILELEELSEDEYSHQITTSNKVVVGDSTLSICSQKIYGDIVKSAGVCENQVMKLVENYATLILKGKTYFFEVNSEKGDKKVVTVRKIINVDNQGLTLDWENFYQHLIDGDQPILNLSGTLYLPFAEDSQLKNFGMQEYGQTGIIFYPENLMEIQSAVFNGTFVLKDRLLFVKQELAGIDQRKIFLKLEDYKIVPYLGEMELNELAQGQVFVTKIGGQKFASYIFGGYWAKEMGLVGMSLQKTGNNNLNLVSKYFLSGESKTYTLDGEKIKFKFTLKEITTPGGWKEKKSYIMVSRAE